MRELGKYTFLEWRRLQPIKHMYKHARNRLVSSVYIKKSCRDMSCNMEKLKTITFPVVTVAYEQPWAIEALVRLWMRNVSGATLVVADNSKSKESRKEISEICQKYGVCYIGLPTSFTKHPNRSHGLAMQWVFDNVIYKLNYDRFAFIDHDLFPVKEVLLDNIVDSQAVFGQEKARSRTDPGAWTVWAGYCFFNKSKIDNFRLNFMYDISRELDTGGMNYEVIYRNLDKSGYKFAEVDRVNIVDNKGDELAKNIQEVDGSWFHVGTIGYNKNAGDRIAVAKRIVGMLLDGVEWDSLKC